MKYESAYQELQERGFIQQVTDPEQVERLLRTEKVTFYVGFDPTADSLHAGHLMAIMGMMHLQRYGHQPIAVVGGGTAMVGDPSGKTEMRKMLSREQIVENGEKIQKQLEHFLGAGENKAIMVDNYEWLGDLRYIDFLRDIGRHFSVNRMLTFETYKMRLEKGLSFLEFNYQLLQSYDFLILSRKYDCRLQMGGDDQWANIIAGADLIRRLDGKEVYGLTFPLLVTASGKKMGKTESGAIWLDPEKTSPYDYFQYWVNVDDRDVMRLLAFFTFLPVDEIRQVENLEGAELNQAKAILAYEATKIAHGEEAARQAYRSSQAAFGKREIRADLLPSSTIPREALSGDDEGIPSATLSPQELDGRMTIVELLSDYDLVPSRSQARRLIQQGGVYLNGERVSDIDLKVTTGLVDDKKITLRIGKKKYFNFIVQEK